MQSASDQDMGISICMSHDMNNMNAISDILQFCTSWSSKMISKGILLISECCGEHVQNTDLAVSDDSPFFACGSWLAHEKYNIQDHGTVQHRNTI
eukprot:208927-Pleurochrysis_carterae.AAC.3